MPVQRKCSVYGWLKKSYASKTAKQETFLRTAWKNLVVYFNGHADSLGIRTQAATVELPHHL
jgi:hypothetical protein